MTEIALHVKSSLYSIDHILLPPWMLYCVFDRYSRWSKSVCSAWSMVSHMRILELRRGLVMTALLNSHQN